MAEILEIGADGAFDIPSEPVKPTQPAFAESAPAHKVAVAETKTKEQKGQLDVLLSQLAEGSYKIVNNAYKSCYLILLKLPNGTTVQCAQFNEQNNAVELITSQGDARDTSSQRKFTLPVPTEAGVARKNNIECNVQQANGGTGDAAVNVVVCVPYAASVPS